MNDDELEDELLANADSWDRCYPRNVNTESLVTGLAEALRRSRRRVKELERAVSQLDDCRSCGNHVEPERYCYARPTCYRCLPPPPPLEVYEIAPPEKAK